MKHTVSEVRLQNGIKGLLIHVPDASVMSYEINFRAGEYLVARQKWETPHLMEHVLLGANQRIPKSRDFQAEFEKNGAYSNASTGAYDITYEAECADFESDRILDLLLVAITKPLFLKDEFEAEFGNVKEELMARSNNHFRHLSLALRELYGFYIMTDQNRLKLVKNVKLRDVKQHYLNTHTTSNLRFVIAGNMTTARRKLIRQKFSNITLNKGKGRESLPIEVPQRLSEPLIIVNKTVDNLYFYVDTFMQRRLSDAEADNLGLLNTMLTETLYSRILGTAREKGLLYHMSSGYSQLAATANWWFGAQVMPKNIPAVFDIMNKELKRVLAGQLRLADIDAAKQYSLGRYQRSGQTVGGTASGYSNRYFFDGKVDDYYKVPERIRAISKLGIIDISRSLFSENVWGLGVLGNINDRFVTDLESQIAPLWSR